MKKEMALNSSRAKLKTTDEKGKNVALIDCSFHLQENG